jgi:hypothetical protein
VGRVESYGNSALLYALIHRSAWKGCSQKFGEAPILTLMGVVLSGRALLSEAN